MNTTLTQNKGQLFLQAVAEEIGREHSGPTVWSLGDAHEMYTRLFWPAHLGVRPFALYEQLRQHVTAVACGYIERPTIQSLAAIFGGRGAVLGRDAARGRKAQAGMLHHLAEEMVLRLRVSGRARQRSYRFGVLLQLPVLTPAQANQMPDRWAEQHERFLGALRGFDLPGWREIAEASLVPDMVSATGWSWLDPDGSETHGTAASGALAQLALVRDGHQCRFCDEPASRADYLIPPSYGGAAVLANLVATCDECLLRKNGRTPEQAGMILRPGNSA